MKVLNYGSLNLDLVYHMEHFIRPGETFGATRLDKFPGGKGLNQSIALARAGPGFIMRGMWALTGRCWWKPCGMRGWIPI